MREEYLERIMNWRNSQMPILRQNRPLTMYNQHKWYKTISSDEKQIIFGVVHYPNDGEEQLIGYCGLTNINFKNRTAEISFLVSPERLTNIKTYASDFTSVLFMLSEYSFQTLNLNKLFTETFSFRKVHISTLLEFGFILEGKLRQHNYENGKYHDSHMHSILRQEWVERYGYEK